MNLLEVDNICKTYGTGETAVHALKKVSFSVPKGEYVAIVGESGSGKSTLLNMISTPSDTCNIRSALCAMLLLCVIIIIVCSYFLDASFNKEMTSLSVSDFTPDITISSQDESNSIDKSISEKISDISGVESVFGMMYSTEYPTEINGNVSTIDLFSHGDAMMDSFKKSVVSGNISKVYGNSQYVMAVYSDQTGLNVGDKIKIGTEELEVACVVSEGVGSVSGSAVVVCSEETYTRLMGEQGYAMLSVVLEKDVSDTAVNKIYELSEGNVVADSRAQNDEVNGSYWVFRIAAYGFLAIISLITILNIMNSVSMGVSARIKQYGAMRAVGMESRQVTKMITAEAATYSICGTTVGIILGLLLHYLIYTKIVITHFGGSWNIPFTTIAMVFILVIFSCIISIHTPAKRIRNMAITETINEL